MRLETLGFFSELGEREKVEYVIINSCHSIVEWNYLLILEEGWDGVEYKQWKKMLLENFCNEELSFFDVIRMEGKKDQELGDIIREIEREGRRVKKSLKDRKYVIMSGVLKNAINFQATIERT